MGQPPRKGLHSRGGKQIVLCDCETEGRPSGRLPEWIMPVRPRRQFKYRQAAVAKVEGRREHTEYFLACRDSEGC